jgi:uncharacterized protein YgfB (UPF0149 family)
MLPAQQQVFHCAVCRVLQELYQKALAVKSAIPHPRILGIIRECGGKMHMHDQVWSEAATDFFEVRGWQCGSRAHMRVGLSSI